MNDETPTPLTDPNSPQNPPRRDRAALVRTRAEAHADAALRSRTQFDRHYVRDIIISAFVSGADLASGEHTQQPEASEIDVESYWEKEANRLRAELDHFNNGRGGAPQENQFGDGYVEAGKPFVREEVAPEGDHVAIDSKDAEALEQLKQEDPAGAATLEKELQHQQPEQ